MVVEDKSDCEFIECGRIAPRSRHFVPNSVSRNALAICRQVRKRTADLRDCDRSSSLHRAEVQSNTGCSVSNLYTSCVHPKNRSNCGRLNLSSCCNAFFHRERERERERE